MLKPQTITAVGIGEAVGGNETFARALRAQVQLRGKDGKFIPEGGGAHFDWRKPDGSVVSSTGTFTGMTNDPQVGQFYVKSDANGLQDGFYSINSNNVQALPKASLTPQQLQQSGVTAPPPNAGLITGDTNVPNQAAIPYSNAPIGWKADGTDQNGDPTSWTTNDGLYTMSPAAYPLQQKTGNTLTLTNNTTKQPAGSFQNWGDGIKEVATLDKQDPTTQPPANYVLNKDGSTAPSTDPNATPEPDAAHSDRADALSQQNGTDPKTLALTAIEPYDNDGTIANLIEQGADSKNVLDALSNNPQWKTAYTSYLARTEVGTPTEDQQQSWAETQREIDAINGLNNSSNLLQPDLSSGNNLDLATGDVAATGYVVPTTGNLETHPTTDLTGDQGAKTVSDYISAHKDELGQKGKRLSVTWDNDNNQVHLDVVDQVADHNTAQQLASQRGITDIFDVANNKPISTSNGKMDPNAHGIPGAPNKDNNEHSSNTDTNAEQPEGHESGTDSGLGSSDGGANPESGSTESSGSEQADHAAEPESDHATDSGNPEHTGPGTEHLGPGLTDEHRSPTLKSSSDTAKSGTTENSSSGADHNTDTSGDSASGKESAGDKSNEDKSATKPAINPADDLPDDPAALQRMATRLESRAAQVQDTPQADSIGKQLDAVYSKISQVNKPGGSTSSDAEGAVDRDKPNGSYGDDKSVINAQDSANEQHQQTITATEPQHTSGASADKATAKLLKANSDKKAADAKVTSAKTPEEHASATARQSTANRNLVQAHQEYQASKSGNTSKPAGTSTPRPTSAPKTAQDHERNVKNAEATLDRAKSHLQAHYDQYGSNKIPANSSAKPEEINRKTQVAKARSDLNTARQAQNDFQAGRTSGGAASEGAASAKDTQGASKAPTESDENPKSTEAATPEHESKVPGENDTGALPPVGVGRGGNSEGDGGSGSGGGTATGEPAAPHAAPVAKPGAGGAAPKKPKILAHIPKKGEPDKSDTPEQSDQDVMSRSKSQSGQSDTLGNSIHDAQTDVQNAKKVHDQATQAGDPDDIANAAQDLKDANENLNSLQRLQQHRNRRTGKSAVPAPGESVQNSDLDKLPAGSDVAYHDPSKDSASELGQHITKNDDGSWSDAQGNQLEPGSELPTDSGTVVHHGEGTQKAPPAGTPVSKPSAFERANAGNRNARNPEFNKPRQPVQPAQNPEQTESDPAPADKPQIPAQLVAPANIPAPSETAPNQESDLPQVPVGGNISDDNSEMGDDQNGSIPQVPQNNQSATSSPEQNSEPASAPASVDNSVYQEPVATQPTPESVPAPTLRDLGPSDGTDSKYKDSQDQTQGAVAMSSDGGYDATYHPGQADEEKASFLDQDDAQAWLGDKLAADSDAGVNPITNQPVGQAPQNATVYSGKDLLPATSAHRTAISNYMASKNLDPEQREQLQNVLDKDGLVKGEADDILGSLKAAPNAPITRSRPRDPNTNPVNFTKASPRLTEVSPGTVSDPNLIIQDVLKNNPGAEKLPNGDVLVESRTVNGKTYDVMIHRTSKERFFTYVRETDPETGNARVSRLQPRESHSYKALTNYLNQAKAFIRSPGADKKFGRKRNLENLPQGANGDIDTLVDPAQKLIDGTDLPLSGDAIKDKMSQVISNMVRRGESHKVLNQFARENNLSPQFVDNIVSSINRQRIKEGQLSVTGANGSDLKSHVPYGGGDPLTAGEWVDWTDPRATLNEGTPNERPNPNYGRVYRGRVVSLRYKTNGGKYLYSDNAYVAFPEMNQEAGLRNPNSHARSRVTSGLKRVSGANAPASAPFFPKALEANDQEKVLNAPSFHIPENPLAGETLPVSRDKSDSATPIDPKLDIYGHRYLGDDSAPVAMPDNATGMVKDMIMGDDLSVPASGVQPGDIIAIHDQGAPRFAKVISTSSAPNGVVTLTHAHYDQDGNLLQKDTTFSGDQTLQVTRNDIANGDLNLPENSTHEVGDRVSVADIPGGEGVITDVSKPNEQGEVTYTIQGPNGQSYSRQDRFVDDVAPEQNAAIQPPSTQESDAWRDLPAPAGTKAILQDKINKKQLSPAAQKKMTNDLAREDFNAGDAHDMITDLGTRKDAPAAPTSTKAPKSDVENSIAVTGKLADDLKSDPESTVDGGHIQDAVDAATQQNTKIQDGEVEADPEYDGYLVRTVKYGQIRTDGQRAPFAKMDDVPGSQMQVGDLITNGTGNYYQIVSKNSSNYDVRVISNPAVDSSSTGIISPIHVANNSTMSVLRPTKNAPKGYFRTPSPTMSTDSSYSQRAQDLLDRYNQGYTDETHLDEGSLNDGTAAFLKLNDGSEIFTKKVEDEGTYWAEIESNKILHAMGYTDTVVTGLPDHRTIISDKVDGDMAIFSRKTDSILAHPEDYPNAKYMGLFDYIALNWDRHQRNWIVNPSGQPVPIDHGEALSIGLGSDNGSPAFSAPVLGRLLDSNEEVAGDGKWLDKEPAFTKAELTQIKQNIGQLEGDFASGTNPYGTQWFNLVTGRLNTLISRY